jgi:hypothetical protein
VRIRAVVIVVGILMAVPSAAAELDKGRAAEKAAVATSKHPYAGFWKQSECTDRFGLAIAPAESTLYSVSFCGPGGCFVPGTYRPNTQLVGDPNYRIINKDTIEVRTALGFSKYVRCDKR